MNQIRIFNSVYIIIMADSGAPPGGGECPTTVAEKYEVVNRGGKR